MHLTIKHPELDLENFEKENYLVSALDHEMRILYWNKGCEQQFGVSREDALAREVHELLPHVKGDPRLQMVQRALQGQKVHILKEKYSGYWGHYEQQLIPLKDAAGSVFAVLNVARNLP
jgi:PAS domain S-box-containing protein